ncbi:SDR family oxidoreductase [Flagellimonas marinaquae]
MSKRIGILGCGWLGFPLAQRLVNRGFTVKGTTTSPSKIQHLQDEGIQPFLVGLSENGIQGPIGEFLTGVDTLIINVPPKLRGNATENYVDKMKHLLEAIGKSTVSQVLFISSTAVYGDAEGEITEDTPLAPVTESGKQLVACENLFRNQKGFTASIIRFGGLIGPDRHPVTTLSGREGLSNGHHPINLIHLEDCIHMILIILDNSYWGETFNGVYPHHPEKQIYYFEEAQKRGLPAPSYQREPASNSGKLVRSANFLKKGHSFTTSVVS